MSNIEAIVIGGSAGALDALLSIMPALPEQVSCPIVIVLHLPPALPNHVPQILSRVCARAVHEAIDVLFESAADAYGPAVAGLVLSGANQDGAKGLWQIRQAGGAAVVQTPATASSPMMPEMAMRRVGPSAHVVRLMDVGAFLTRLVGAKTRHGELL
jgi:two-component system chemotaxis response regulator CheB